eukprot:CAMPEP_0198601852 /NCGR_PEP_ID=MMETSP1462-20131121/150009_1 /TAXON_ID=1333877 /ORGANISM="Brandtodinium nutriculum, Strain RCC3387" /LENGTH=59 /DNA_ID=CAMNT_0044333591 /DNA_START=1 /DNA_END=177 /DNA_ORIENTATION=+
MDAPRSEQLGLTVVWLSGTGGNESEVVPEVTAPAAVREQAAKSVQLARVFDCATDIKAP